MENSIADKISADLIETIENDFYILQGFKLGSLCNYIYFCNLVSIVENDTWGVKLCCHVVSLSHNFWSQHDPLA